MVLLCASCGHSSRFTLRTGGVVPRFILSLGPAQQWPGSSKKSSDKDKERDREVRKKRRDRSRDRETVISCPKCKVAWEPYTGFS